MLSAGKIEQDAALDAARELGARLTVVRADADTDAVGPATAELVVTVGKEISGMGVTGGDALEPCALLHEESKHTTASAPAMPIL